MAIKLEIDPETGDVGIVRPESTREYHECLVDDCELALPDYVCGVDSVSIWEHYRDSGFCPQMKWYKETRVKDFCREERERERRKSKYSFTLEKEEQ